jgi:hypothetical protein
MAEPTDGKTAEKGDGELPAPIKSVIVVGGGGWYYHVILWRIYLARSECPI